MKQITLLILVVILVFQAFSLSCNFGYVPLPNELGCIKACNHPDYANCKPVFVTFYNPRYCGLKNDGTWKTFSYECQACVTSGFLGVKKGKCTCEELECSSNQKCVNGACLSIQNPCHPRVSTPIGCIQSCDDA